MENKKLRIFFTNRNSRHRQVSIRKIGSSMKQRIRNRIKFKKWVAIKKVTQRLTM